MPFKLGGVYQETEKLVSVLAGWRPIISQHTADHRLLAVADSTLYR